MEIFLSINLKNTASGYTKFNNSDSMQERQRAVEVLHPLYTTTALWPIKEERTKDGAMKYVLNKMRTEVKVKPKLP